MNKIETIWDIKKDGGQSTVLKGFNGDVLKLYYSSIVSENILNKYVKLQNKFSDLEKIFNLKESFIFNGEEINKIHISILKLNNEFFQGSDIESKKKIFISKIDYVEGIHFDELFKISENLLIDIMVAINDLTGLNMYRKEGDKLFLQTNIENAKIVNVEGGTMYIKVTDIAEELNSFVKNNSGINSLINKVSNLINKIF